MGTFTLIAPTAMFFFGYSVGDPEKGLEFVFEGVRHNSLVDHVVPHFDTECVNPRLQLCTDEPNVRAEYSGLYEEQLRNIIEGYEVVPGEEEPIAWTSTIEERKKIKRVPKNRTGLQPPVQRVKGLFPPLSESGSYSNWKGVQTILQGGTNIQHPHCDNAIVNSYNNLDVFPFVCVHAFGVSEFKMWLLPNPLQRHYGFEHTFEPKNMLLMRGDFVHAGGPGRFPRAHMEFFPRETAGWTRKRSFWNIRGNKVHPTFLWQKPTYPFGFPSVTEPDAEGDVTITYPPNLTRLLRTPMSKKQCLDENVLFVAESKKTRHVRREICAKVQSQSW